MLNLPIMQEEICVIQMCKGKNVGMSAYTAVDIAVIAAFAILLIFVIITLLTLSKTTDIIGFIYKVRTQEFDILPIRIGYHSTQVLHFA
jgi:hypothetical protein